MGSGQTYAGNETRENDQPLQESQECQEYVAVRTYLEMIIENDHGVLYTVCRHSVGIVIRMFLVMLLDNYYSLKEIIIIIIIINKTKKKKTKKLCCDHEWGCSPFRLV